MTNRERANLLTLKMPGAPVPNESSRKNLDEFFDWKPMKKWKDIRDMIEREFDAI